MIATVSLSDKVFRKMIFSWIFCYQPTFLLCLLITSTKKFIIFSKTRPGIMKKIQDNKGILFLDELPEFKKHVLEVLRQPLEDKKVTISRAKISITFPADFMLVAAMNPCPCGYLGDDKHTCICTPAQIQKYRSKISGPLLDRIDLHVEVPAVAYKDLKQESGMPDSKTMRENILKAREIQAKRYKGLPIKTNSELKGKWLNEFCKLGEKEHDFLEKAVNRLGLSARAYTRILRISRTIADLSGDEKINISHLAEAINYRNLDRTNISFF